MIYKIKEVTELQQSPVTRHLSAAICAKRSLPLTLAATDGLGGDLGVRIQKMPPRSGCGSWTRLASWSARLGPTGLSVVEIGGWNPLSSSQRFKLWPAKAEKSLSSQALSSSSDTCSGGPAFTGCGHWS